jgi:cephalosporin hydroxylase
MGLEYDPNRFKHYGNRSEDRLKNNYFLAIPGLFNFDDIYSSEVNRIKDGGTIVEIGIWQGKSTAWMAEAIKDSKKDINFYAIDHDVSNLNEHITPVKDYVNILNLDSVKASKQFEDKSLDFVFIDGDHRYSGVMKDIYAWDKKIKDGGCIAGHDYIKDHDTLEVWDAVNDFYGKANVLNIRTSWYIRK